MKSITKPTHPDNIGSIIKLWFAPVSEIANISRPINNYGGISLKAGSDWYEFYFSPQSGQYKHELKSSNQGSYYEMSITGSSPRLSPDLDVSLIKMKDGAFVCKIFDANGFYRIVGSIDFPLKFDFDAFTGSSPQDKNGISYSFKGQSRYPPFFITSDAGSE